MALRMAAKLRQEGYMSLFPPFCLLRPFCPTFADYFFASPNPISSSGSIVTVERTGTKTAGQISSSDVVFFAGLIKIVAGGVEETHERVNEFAVALESF
ncbi:hypothetical protein M427DRAFT_31119 [Gonapodya prolifera JEL478]|uniref:Uncharacterized protein n=1 Tax=Gonapodya prolifera (strain JEL478) TaxID=1344416 RepID=A0A139AIW3_GONPJ|nr:hypothetical protein M427DRAFT_31119 [Gonapodya prolifera JEL478]|eukprot:KXS16736.1 hypothetical protein M427DRAFT_31119 [Gonapodya prolifera JEL478]